MFGKQESRAHRAERIAGQAWENLVSAVDSAGASTRSASKRAAGYLDDTTNRVGSGTKEARARASAAFDALAGRRQSRPWGWLAAATLVGAALGWAATTFGRKAMSRQDPLEVPNSLADDALAGDPLLNPSRR